jgi:hypothetical protein
MNRSSGSRIGASRDRQTFTGWRALHPGGIAAGDRGDVVGPRRRLLRLLVRARRRRQHFAYTAGDQDTDPDGPDNITVSPYGGVIVAEDGEGASHLVGSTKSGETFFLARNELPGESEFTGPAFSADKSTLSACIQSPGHVFAITGPFVRQR